MKTQLPTHVLDSWCREAHWREQRLMQSILWRTEDAKGRAAMLSAIRILGRK